MHLISARLTESSPPSNTVEPWLLPGVQTQKSEEQIIYFRNRPAPGTKAKTVPVSTLRRASVWQVKLLLSWEVGFF